MLNGVQFNMVHAQNDIVISKGGRREANGMGA